MTAEQKRQSKAEVRPGWVYLATHPASPSDNGYYTKVGRSARDPRSNDPTQDTAGTRFRMLNFTLRTFGLPPLIISEAVHVSDAAEVELRLRREFECRQDCGSSREVLNVAPADAQVRLLEIARLFPLTSQ